MIAIPRDQSNITSLIVIDVLRILFICAYFITCHVTSAIDYYLNLFHCSILAF